MDFDSSKPRPIPRYMQTGLSPDDPDTLTVAQARRMQEMTLRELFGELVNDLVEYDDDELPADFPRAPWDLSVPEIYAALERFAYWFDPHGKHAKPVYDSTRRDLEAEGQLAIDLPDDPDCE